MDSQSPFTHRGIFECNCKWGLDEETNIQVPQFCLDFYFFSILASYLWAWKGPWLTTSFRGSLNNGQNTNLEWQRRKQTATSAICSNSFHMLLLQYTMPSVELSCKWNSFIQSTHKPNYECEDCRGYLFKYTASISGKKNTSAVLVCVNYLTDGKNAFQLLQLSQL